MKFILLYRGITGAKQFQIFETREEAVAWSKTSAMAGREILGVFELDSPLFI